MTPRFSSVRLQGRLNPVGRTSHRAFFGGHESLAATWVSSAMTALIALLNTCLTAMRAQVSGSGI